MDFWSFVDKAAAEECWTWAGETFPSGHGLWEKRKLLVYAHREAWEKVNGKLPAGTGLARLCHNPLCCNPAHWTQRSFDASLPGFSVIRVVVPQNDALPPLAPASRNYQVVIPESVKIKVPKRKLSDEEVLWIRENPKVSTYVLKERFGISRSTAHAIRTGKSYRDVGLADANPVKSSPNRKRNNSLRWKPLLTEEQVRYIRNSSEGVEALSAKFGVSKSTISKTRSGERRGDVK